MRKVHGWRRKNVVVIRFALENISSRHSVALPAHPNLHARGDLSRAWNDVYPDCIGEVFSCALDLGETQSWVETISGVEADRAW